MRVSPNYDIQMRDRGRDLLVLGIARVSDSQDYVSAIVM